MKNLVKLIFLWLIIWGVYFNTPVYLILHPPFLVSFLQKNNIDFDSDILLYNIDYYNHFLNYDKVLLHFMKNETPSSCKKCISISLRANSILNEKYKKNDLIYNRYTKNFSENEDVKKIKEKQEYFDGLSIQLNKQYAETKIIDKELEKKVELLNHDLDVEIKKYNENLIIKWEKIINESK